jgi:hypothetical protein
MAKFLVRLSDDELEALRAAAAERGCSMNDLAREGIRQVGREERIRFLTRRIMAEDDGILQRLADS